MWLIVLVTLIVLLPFVAKPFHVDDPMYLWAGGQIRQHPFDFYGFDAAWTGSLHPMSVIMQNPPLTSYVIAIVSAVAGMREVALHLAFFIPAVGLALGTYALGKRMCARPLLAALVTVFTPAFVVCATTIGSDVLMSCFWVWTMFLWDRGLRDHRCGSLIGAAFLAAAACLTKYPAINLLPLMAVHVLLRRAPLSRLFTLMIPVAALIVYEIMTRRMYGRGLFAEAVMYASSDRSIRESNLFSSVFVSVCFTGACIAPAMLLGPALWRWIGGVAMVATLGITLMALNGLSQQATSHLNIDPGCEFGWPLKSQLAIWFVGGMVVIAASAMNVIRRRDADSIMLALWILGTIAFAGVVNWSVNARTILPMIPAAAIVIARGLEVGLEPLPMWRRAWVGGALLMGLTLSLCAAWTDQALARSARDAAIRIMEKYGSTGSPVWFQGHWGFQFYMEQHGGKPWLVDQSQSRVGDVIVFPRFNVNVELMDERWVANVDLVSQPAAGWVSTMNVGVGAAFYSHIFGPLPFVFGEVPEERYLICRFRRPIGPADQASSAASKKSGRE